MLLEKPPVFIYIGRFWLRLKILTFERITDGGK